MKKEKIELKSSISYVEKQKVGRPKSGNYRKSYWANPETHDKIQQLVEESKFINKVQSANLSKCEKEALKNEK